MEALQHKIIQGNKMLDTDKLIYYCTIDIDSSDEVVTTECNPPPGDSVIATDEASGAVSIHPLGRVMSKPFLSVFGKVTHTGQVDDV